MLFRRQMQDPKKLMSIGMFCLAFAMIWMRYPVFDRALGPQWGDGLRGLLFGIAIGLNLLSVWRRRPRPCT